MKYRRPSLYKKLAPFPYELLCWVAPDLQQPNHAVFQSELK